MSQLDVLVQKLCPNGVEHKAIGDIGTISRGKRFVKTDIVESGIPCIHYGELYTKYGTWADTSYSFLEPTVASRLRFASKGDVILVSAGETIEDIGKSVAWLGDEDVVIHDALYAIRSSLDPKYVAYFSQTDDFHNQIRRHISSSKISAISTQNVGKVKIPVPPIEIQQEIVRILDTFSKLEAELEAELEARRLQYTFYRDRLLTFAERERRIRWARMTEVSAFIRGTAMTQRQAVPGPVPVVANGPIRIYSHSTANRTGETIVVARSGAYAGLVTYWNEPLFLTDAFSVHPDTSILRPKFVYYFLQNSQQVIHSLKKGAGVPHVRVKEVENLLIPIPSLEEQDRIVAVLDKFDVLANDLSDGLPAELLARRQQYAYYRDRLLTFKEAG